MGVAVGLGVGAELGEVGYPEGVAVGVGTGDGLAEVSAGLGLGLVGVALGLEVDAEGLGLEPDSDAAAGVRSRLGLAAEGLAPVLDGDGVADVGVEGARLVVDVGLPVAEDWVVGVAREEGWGDGVGELAAGLAWCRP